MLTVSLKRQRNTEINLENLIKYFNRNPILVLHHGHIKEMT